MSSCRESLFSETNGVGFAEKRRGRKVCRHRGDNDLDHLDAPGAGEFPGRLIFHPGRARDGDRPRWVLSRGAMRRKISTSARSLSDPEPVLQRRGPPGSSQVAFDWTLISSEFPSEWSSDVTFFPASSSSTSRRADGSE